MQGREDWWPLALFPYRLGSCFQMPGCRGLKLLLRKTDAGHLRQFGAILDSEYDFCSANLSALSKLFLKFLEVPE